MNHVRDTWKSRGQQTRKKVKSLGVYWSADVAANGQARCLRNKGILRVEIRAVEGKLSRIHSQQPERFPELMKTVEKLEESLAHMRT